MQIACPCASASIAASKSRSSSVCSSCLVIPSTNDRPRARGSANELDHRSAEQLADNLVDVTARTEAAPFAGNHDGPDLTPFAQRGEQIPQLRIYLECQGVQTIRSIEHNRGDRA